MSDKTETNDGISKAIGHVQQIAKALAFLAVAFTFLQIGINVPTFARVTDEQLKLSRLQVRQVERLVTDTENLSQALNDAALIYAARMAASEKAIPARNADQIVDAATDRLAGRFGKEWEVIIRGAAARLDNLTRR